MQWRKALLSGSAALGAAAAYNALARQGINTLGNPLEGEEHRYQWRGHSVVYTRCGEGPPVLLVHGLHAAAWSLEWRHTVPALARGHTVYALDLLGFGRSDRPALRYTAGLYLALLGDFARDVVGAPCLLVGRALTAAYAIALGARDPGSFPALVLVEPTGLVRQHGPATTGGEVTRLALEAPVVGTSLFNGMVSRRSLRYYLERLYVDHALVTEDLVDVYFAAAHQEGAKHAPAALLGGHLDIDVRHALRRLRQPALLVWGEQASEVPVEDARGFLVLKPDLEVTVIDHAGDLPHDERSDVVNGIIANFADRAVVWPADAPTPDEPIRAEPAPARPLRLVPTHSASASG